MKQLAFTFFAILGATPAAFGEEPPKPAETTVVTPSLPQAAPSVLNAAPEAEKVDEKKQTPPDSEWVHPTK
ncbi:MAG: hypothetical protein ACR65Z_07310 [Methylocystis sp.]